MRQFYDVLSPQLHATKGGTNTYALNTVCQETGIAIGIDYTIQPQPSLPTEDFAWVQFL